MECNTNTVATSQLCKRLEFAEVAPSIESTDKQISEQISHSNSSISVDANLPGKSVPKVGMEFDFEQDVYDFYNKYAKEVGFSIRRSKGHQDRYGNWLNRVFCCSCEGIRRKDKRDDDVKSHRPETRFECLAVLKVSRLNGKLRITEFVADHTHALASPSKRMFLRSQRTINTAQAAELELAARSGLAPKEEDFLNAWNQMLAKYNLENNNWLQKQFELREKWALVYGRQTFCADMSTTQRSESMNNQIKLYIGYNYDLLRFFHHFEGLLADKRYEELKADYKDKPPLPHPVEILKHAADVYTLAVFK